MKSSSSSSSSSKAAAVVSVLPAADHMQLCATAILTLLSSSAVSLLEDALEAAHNRHGAVWYLRCHILPGSPASAYSDKPRRQLLVGRSATELSNLAVQLEVLNTLEANDPDGLHHCVRLKEWFEYRSHVCMVFERLGLSLYDFLRKNSYKPFHIELVRLACQAQLVSVCICTSCTVEKASQETTQSGRPLCKLPCKMQSPSTLSW